MNYLKQILGFKRKRLSEPISSNAICLYYILLEYANELCFPKSFTAANSVISSRCAFSQSTLVRRRNELCDKGYITYYDGEMGKCGTYSIAPLTSRIWEKFDTDYDEDVTILNKYKYIDKYKYNIYNAPACAYDSSDSKPKRFFIRGRGDDVEE